MKLKVYVETSVISAYFDLRTPERMSQTRKFWEILKDYESVISNQVVEELERIKEAKIKSEVQELIKELIMIPEPPGAVELAENYISKEIFPQKYFDDALHLAIATVSGCNILVSWNFKHLVKRKTRIEANLVNSLMGYSTIDILAPPEL